MLFSGTLGNLSVSEFIVHEDSHLFAAIGAGLIGMEREREGRREEGREVEMG